MKHKIRNQKKGLMYSLIKNYLEENLSQKDFCSTHNLSFRKFQYWYRRYKREFPVDNNVSFVPLKIDEIPQVMPSEEMKICYPNGVFIELSASTSCSILKTLISLI